MSEAIRETIRRFPEIVTFGLADPLREETVDRAIEAASKSAKEKIEALKIASRGPGAGAYLASREPTEETQKRQMYASSITNDEYAKKLAQGVKSGSFTDEGEKIVKQALLDYHRRTRPSGSTAELSAVSQGMTRGIAGLATPPLGASGTEVMRGVSGLVQDLGGDPIPAEVADVPDDLKPFFRGGQTTSEILSFAIPFFGAASRAQGIGGRMLSPQAVAPKLPATSIRGNVGGAFREMTRSTARQPGRAGVQEALMALGAGTGATIAEEAAPGDDTMRLVGELGGGLAAMPSQLLLQTLGKGGQKLGRAVSTEARQREAAKRLREGLERGGFLEADQRILAKELARPDRTFTNFTIAQAVDEPAIRRLEQTLLNDASQAFKKQYSDKTKKNVNEFEKSLRALENSGSPHLVRKAAELRLENFTRRLNDRVQTAQSRADNAVSQIIIKDSGATMKASKAAREILESELKNARQTENMLWEKVDKNVLVDPIATLNARQTISSQPRTVEGQDLITGQMKKILAGISRRSAGGPQDKMVNAVKVSDLQNARSQALEDARRFRKEGKNNKANASEELAKAMLDDLSKVTDESANLAREFSANLNQKFNTEQMRRMLKRDAAPETMISKELGQDADNALVFRALREATERTIDPMILPQKRKAMIDAQQRFIKGMANQTFNAKGSVDVKALQTFVSKYPNTLKEVGLIGEVRQADDLSRIASYMQGMRQNVVPKFLEKTQASQILKKGVDGEIDRAMKNENMDAIFSDMVRTIKRSGQPGAFEGFQHAVLDDLIKRSTKSMELPSGETIQIISGQLMKDALGTKKGGKVLGDVLLSKGILTNQQANGLNKLIERSTRLEKAIGEKGKIDELVVGGDGLLNLAARWLGAQIGAKSSLAQGSTLLAAGAGARKSVSFFETVPNLHVQNILRQAILDPKFMGELLSKEFYKTGSPAFTRIKAFVGGSGIGQVSPAIEDLKESD
tara:strand:- start:496 stop:3423 length:2928 start_codon:yes stop_codon:yes gene_type:complete